MASRYLLFLADEKDRERGGISFFDDAKEAAGHAESLLEAGYEQDRIRIFSSDEMDVEVTHKPVVSLTGADREASQPSEATVSPEAESDDDDDDDDDEKSEVAGVKDGVRLSSLFKTD
ncbi:MAG: hypothetical protein IH957_05905 [Chloroflexi bacterium]|nr:hypothetical protein [Chloroflexota bacterium]